MFCCHCGKELPDGIAFCQYCGNPTGSAPKQKTVIPFKRPQGIEIAKLVFAGVLCALLMSDILNANGSCFNLFGSLFRLTGSALFLIAEIFAYMTLAAFMFVMVCSYINMGNFSHFGSMIGTFAFYGLYSFALLFTTIGCIVNSWFSPSGLFYITVVVFVLGCFVTFASKLVQKLSAEKQ